MDGASTGPDRGALPASHSLCASCDRCRARKTKCDGKRPCSACKHKFMKKHKLANCDGVDPAVFECNYSPAKRRGPIPGHKMRQSDTSSQASPHAQRLRAQPPAKKPTMAREVAQRVASMYTGSPGRAEARPQGTLAALSAGLPSARSAAMSIPDPTGSPGSLGSNRNFHLSTPLDPGAAALQQQILSSLSAIGLGVYAAVGGMPGLVSAGGDTMASSQAAAKQQLAYLRQLQLQQQIQAGQTPTPHARTEMPVDCPPPPSTATVATVATPPANAATAPAPPNTTVASPGVGNNETAQPITGPSEVANTQTMPAAAGCQKVNVVKFLHLLEPADADGMRLRACYALSFGGLFGLPPIPSDEDYCRRFEPSGSLEPHLLPKFDIAALQAARFAEVALGALANGQKSIVLELANASVLCLQDCVAEPVHPSCMFDVARTYFFHGICRSYFGDIEKYFKYRRVSLTHLAQLDGVAGVDTLMAAISFQDSLAYMMHNGSGDDLPDINNDIPLVSKPHNADAIKVPETERKYGISSIPSLVASYPMNQMWIQGPPPVFINENAPPKSRIIDALACAMRSSLDESKARFNLAVNSGRKRKHADGSLSELSEDEERVGPTETGNAVRHNWNELSCRNILAEAANLLQKYEEASPSLHCTYGGHHILIHAMDIICNVDRNSPGELDDTQIQNLLGVLKTIIERPILLFQGGPSYHIFNNSAVIMAHFLNKLHAEGIDYESAKALYEESLDVYNASRMVLNSHRSKLPCQLRCHELPRPDTHVERREPLIKFNMTPLCTSRCCQDCVFMGATSEDLLKLARMTATEKSVSDDAKSLTSSSMNEYDRQRSQLEKEFDVDDHALLLVLSRIISPHSRRQF